MLSVSFERHLFSILFCKVGHGAQQDEPKLNHVSGDAAPPIKTVITGPGARAGAHARQVFLDPDELKTPLQ